VPRFDYDPVTLAARGLLIEEQRINFALRSEDFSNSVWQNSTPNIPTVTVDSTTAPDGTTTADLLTASTGGTNSQVRQATTTSTTGNFTGSVFLKAGSSTRSRVMISDQTTTFVTIGDFQIAWSGGVASIHSTSLGTASIVPYGNGWYRCVITASAASANANIGLSIFPDSVSGTGSVNAWGAEVEAGAFATSYIPTAATTVQRNQDVVSMTGDNFTSWFNASQGTFVVGADSFADTSVITRQSVVAHDGTASNYIRSYTYNGNWGSMVVTGGATQFDQAFASVVPNVAVKLAFAYQTNNFASCLNNGSVTTDTSGTVPTVTQLSLGQYSTAGNVLNGHLNLVSYYPTRLSNTQLQALTS
jgi:hypothetical protein